MVTFKKEVLFLCFTLVAYDKTLMKKVLLIGLLFCSIKVSATHLRAGSISVERINCTSRTFRVTITVYTDLGSNILFGGTQDILDFGDGTRVLVPETPNTTVPGGNNIGVASRSFLHTFPGSGRYTISYIEPNRNAGVLNMSNSVNTTFYTETQIDISPLTCSNSPIILIPPIDIACVGNAFTYNSGAYDPDGDSLSYEFAIPFRDRNTQVNDYKSLVDPIFYPNYLTGNEVGDGAPALSINNDGTIIWDAASLPSGVNSGEYSLAFLIKEWREISGQLNIIGYVRLDMQIIVNRCNNTRPQITIPESYCVEPGTTINHIIYGNDPEANPVKIEALSQIFNSGFPSSASLLPEPVFQATPAQVQFSWNTTSEHIQKSPHQIIFKITDNPNDGTKLSTYKSFSIRVVGPAPIIKPVVLDQATASAQISWDTYSYENVTMQVWRKVGSNGSSVDACDIGALKTWGYKLIGEVPQIGEPITQFNDTNNGSGLNVGAKYCYRLVAKFANGAESYVSEEICIDPIPVIVPLVTKVSVTKTSLTSGEIEVVWIPPFDINTEQFPEPYTYIVQQDNGAGFINASQKISDLSFTDNNLNTADKSYTYRILLYSSNDVNSIGTSASASSLRLSLNSSFQKINLTWQANVPWSNQLAEVSVHEIYRGLEGESETSFTKIANVNAWEGSAYRDTGDPDIGLSNEIYCYRVLVKGGYDNPELTQPLVNYTQVNCVKAIIVNADEEAVPVIHVYPNPTTQFLKLMSGNSGASEIVVYDQQGKLILKQAVQNGETIIDLSELKNGLYICDVRKGQLSLKRIRIIKI
jgi:hypothetical protein